MLRLDGCQAIGGDGRRFGPLFGRETAAGIGGSKKMRRDDRFSGPTTHVSPTALNLAQNAQKSEPIWKNKPSINKSKAHYAKHTKTTRRFRQSANRFAVVLALAAGAAGVWSELKAAPVTGNAGSQMPVRGSQIDVAAGSDTNSISGSVSENGDGTATVSVFQSQFAILSGTPNLVIQTFNLLLANDPANTTCSQTVNIKPGASG